MSDGTLTDQLERLESRLARIGAAAITLREIGRRLDDGRTSPALIDVLGTLDRDLLLAAHDLDEAQRLAMREVESLSGAPERVDAD